MDADDFKKIEDMFRHHVGMMTEDFQHKLDIVIEGNQILNEKIDRLDGRVDGLEAKVDAVASDLATHRSDTELHHEVYRVRESGE